MWFQWNLGKQEATGFIPRLLSAHHGHQETSLSWAASGRKFSDQGIQGSKKSKSRRWIVKTGKMLMTNAGVGTIFICHKLLCGESRMASNGMFSGALPGLILHDKSCSVFFHGALE